MTSLELLLGHLCCIFERSCVSFLFIAFFSLFFYSQIPAFVPKKRDPEPVHEAAPVSKKEPESKKETMFTSFQV